MLITAILYTFFTVVLIQVIYYLVFGVFAFAKSTAKASNNLPISVIICAKNEAENLRKNLPSVLHQNYDSFEVVLINDASSDETLDVMQDFKNKHNNIKIVNVENNEAFWGNKKYALTLGIKAAKHEHLLFTDADCEVNSKHWISEMTSKFSFEKSIVLGYGKYKSKKYSLVNLVVRFETLLTAIQYFSYAKIGSPYMGVGRNLAYTKSEFYKVKGFINHMNIRSGDDDLFIKDAANGKNTTICFSENSHTISEAPKTLKAWFRQKRRHISTAKHYKFKHQFFLSLFFVSKFLVLFLSTLLFFLYDWKIIASGLAIYYLLQYIVIGFSAKKLKESQIIFFLPFLEIGLVLFQFSIFIANSISKPTHWK